MRSVARYLASRRWSVDSGAGVANLDYSEMRGQAGVSAPNRIVDPLGSNESGLWGEALDCARACHGAEKDKAERTGG